MSVLVHMPDGRPSHRLVLVQLRYFPILPILRVQPRCGLSDQLSHLVVGVTLLSARRSEDAHALLFLRPHAGDVHKRPGGRVPDVIVTTTRMVNGIPPASHGSTF